MKKAKYLLSIVLVFTVLFSTVACSNTPETKTGTATAQGFGGPITVTVTVTDGVLTDVKVEGPSESAGIGSIAVEQLPAKMLEAKSVDVDVISGATISSKAILAAAAEAYANAMGEEVGAEVKMAPGTYTNEVWAFSPNVKMEVAVTVSEDKILSIEVGKNGETEPILQNAIDLYIPRILENQSIAVDAITGATGSSGGIRLGVMKALEQALEAAESDPAAITAFQKPIPKVSGKTETLNYDVVVVGMGGSGSAAAMSAAEAQVAAGQEVSVLAIEKAGKYGGTSAVTSEMMAINPPRFMKDNNYEVRKIQLGVFERPLEDTRKDKSVYVDVEEMKSAWLEYTEGDAKEEMLDLMLNHSGETLDWLVYEHGFTFGKPQLGVEPSATYFCVYQYNDSFMDNKHIIITYFDTLYDHFTKLGGQYMLETEAYELLYDKDTKTVTGVKAVGADGTEYIINAKAVILATGGFCGNGEMTSELLSDEYYPLKGTWNMVGMTQNDGKMIASALDIGAGTYNIGMAPIVHIGGSRVLLHDFETYTVEIDGETKTVALNDVPMIMSISGNVMTVNKEGKRFTAETGLGFLEPWKGGPEFYSIWSDDQIQKVREEGFATVTVGAFINQGGVPTGYPIKELDEVINVAMEKGICYKADTLEELAAELGIDADNFLQTVETYNGYCAEGVDADFGKAADFLIPIKEGPYYAFVGAPYAYSTCGGLDINTKFQVLRPDGQTPINGLYSCGTDCLGVLLSEKKAYVTYGGAAQGWAYTSGKLAGESAVKNMVK
ncbi:MAG TPA: FAD-dependent oxidoreductase [Firmicutes bacterium]|nr:FAD-dependent oxidoreductase [Bacillota bacterium]